MMYDGTFFMFSLSVKIVYLDDLESDSKRVKNGFNVSIQFDTNSLNIRFSKRQTHGIRHTCNSLAAAFITGQLSVVQEIKLFTFKSYFSKEVVTFAAILIAFSVFNSIRSKK